VSSPALWISVARLAFTTWSAALRYGMKRCLASPKKTRTGSRGPVSDVDATGPESLVLSQPKSWTPLMGFIKDRPSTDKHCVSTPSKTPKSSTFGLSCQTQTCSALAVSRDFSGLLHAVPCRFIAPYNRPWGSPCFQQQQIRRPANAFPNGALPYEAFPSLTAEKTSPPTLAETNSCVHRNLIPSRRCSWVNPASDRVATTRPRPLPVTRPQGIEPPKNPLRSRDVATTSRSMLPWAFFQPEWCDAAIKIRAVGLVRPFRRTSGPLQPMTQGSPTCLA
jgi:hypothetical protein